MRTHRHPLHLGVVAVLALGAPSFAQNTSDNTHPAPPSSAGFQPANPIAPLNGWSDNFNRPNGIPLGPDWTDHAGSYGINANHGYSLGTANQWTQHNTATGTYATSSASLDFLPKVQGGALIYVALVFGVGASSDNVFIKVQDNNSDGTYDRVYFYRGINGGSWTANSAFDLAIPTVSGRMSCYFTANGDVANIDIDRNFDGAIDEHFQAGGILAAAMTLGSGFAIGTYNSPEFDSWTASDGTVPPITVYCTSGTSSNGCVASIAGNGSPSASAASGFTISVSSVEGQKQGILFYGINNTAYTPLPWGMGTAYLCVKHPSQRMGVQNSGGTFSLCDGALSIDWNTFRSTHPNALGVPFIAGQHAFAQGWFRDPLSPKTTMLSNALEFVLAP